jgi:hypothetical protein
LRVAWRNFRGFHRKRGGDRNGRANGQARSVTITILPGFTHFQIERPMHSIPSRRYAGWLWVLLTLFAVRVVAQPAARLRAGSFLPPFESWHSGALPYPVLLCSQVLILAWLVWTARGFTTGIVEPSRRVGRVTLALGGVYFGGMVLRLLLGATILHGQRWFASPLPTFFHLVLSLYLVLFGHFHSSHVATADMDRHTDYV